MVPIYCRSGDLGLYEVYIYILYARKECKSAVATYARIGIYIICIYYIYVCVPDGLLYVYYVHAAAETRENLTNFGMIF